MVLPELAHDRQVCFLPPDLKDCPVFYQDKGTTVIQDIQSFCKVKEVYFWDFPSGPVIENPHFHCSAHGFDPWSGI